MSDRVSVKLYFSDEDYAHRMADVLDADWGQGEWDTLRDGKGVSLTYHEVKYAGGISSEDPGELPTDIPYHGWHGGDLDWTEGLFANVPGKGHAYTQAIEGGPAITLNKDGEVELEPLIAAQAYIQMRKKVEGGL